MARNQSNPPPPEQKGNPAKGKASQIKLEANKEKATTTAASDRKVMAGGASLLHAVAALMSTCTRRLQRAARRVSSAAAAGKQGASSRAVVPWRKALSLPAAATAKVKAAAAARREEGDSGGLWRKEILMGERCQPLDFSGVIYYDADGRRLAHPPPPRSPMRSPLPVSGKLAANARAAY
uniref:Uncharacterized protein n=1 Tax=Oryza meridionalis TaxID=40149 RepID=A0A0E0E281_9ORYZ